MPNPWIENLPGPRLVQVIKKNGPALKARYGTDDVYFAIWLHALDRVVQRQVGFFFDDLEDWGYWDAYEADMSPHDAAMQMLADTGWGVES